MFDSARQLIGSPATGPNVYVSDLSSAVTLTVPADAEQAVIQALGAQVAVTFDGTTPSSTNGIVLSPGDIMICQRAEFRVAKLKQLSASAALQIYYSR